MAARSAFAVGLINFKNLFLKILRLGKLSILGFSLFHLMMTLEKKVFLKELRLTALSSRVKSDEFRNYIKKIFWRSVFQNFIKAP